MALDRIDLKILRALQNDARLSNKELAGIVGLAPSSCLERVRRLRKEKILLGSHARIEPSAVGIGLQAMIAVQLGRHSRDIVQRFRDHVAELEPVVAVYHIAGGFDFLVHVAVRDANHLRDLALDSFTTRPEVEHLQTSLIFQYEPQPGIPDYLSL